MAGSSRNCSGRTKTDHPLVEAILSVTDHFISESENRVMLFGAIDFVMQEAALFAACGFLLLGLSDLAVDLIWTSRTVWRKAIIYRRFERAEADTLAEPSLPGRMAIFVPAWDESDVIGYMLRRTLSIFGRGDYSIYVGCYPNDRESIAAIMAVGDKRVRIVIGPVPGPTTKSDCLNRIWRSMLEDEGEQGFRYKAVVLHDAEDVVSAAELRIFDLLVERFDLVQLPVLPLLNRHSRWIVGHYADEFAEAHGKELIVREALGASLPSAGVGCAFSRDALERIAGINGGAPFDADSLTEDYEFGLRLHQIGGRAAFVRLPASLSRPLVATQEHFPATLEAAVKQKARWMMGIALSGWDRLGWRGSIAERWMRLRDRQAVLASLLLFAGYVSALLCGVLQFRQLPTGIAPEPLSAGLEVLLQLNLSLFAWRLGMRFLFVKHAYGWGEAFRALPRVFISNLIAMLAARRAVARYLATRRTGTASWEKTKHFFPADLPAA